MVENYFNDIKSLIDKLKDVEFDCVLGVIRGGYIPAEAISRYFNREFCIVDVKSYFGDKQGDLFVRGKIGEPFGRVLIVDDLVDSGKTLEFLKTSLESKGLTAITAVLWNKVNNERKFQVDYSVRNAPCDEWITQPMEQMFDNRS